jgi:hypothetical protein
LLNRLTFNIELTNFTLIQANPNTQQIMKTIPFFADIHPHTSFKYVYNNQDLWKSIDIRHPLIERVLGMTAYSQSDFRRMAIGGTELAFIGLHAVEQRMNFLNGALGTILEEPAERLACYLTKIPDDAIDFMQTKDYDHYAQLMREKEQLSIQQNRHRKLFVGGLKRKVCKFQVVNDYTEINDIIERNRCDKKQFTIAVVLTIEGIYNIGRAHLSFNGPNRFNVRDERLLARIDNLKGIDNEEGNGWSYTPVWVALSHLFPNGIMGTRSPSNERLKSS